MKKKVLIICSIVISICCTAQTSNVAVDYQIPLKEIDCFKNFKYDQAPGRNKINTYLLAKLSQMVYTERLDFELRKLRNPTGFPSSSFKSGTLNTTSNANFEKDFAKRFSHWFYDINSKPMRSFILNNNLAIANPKSLNTDKLVGNKVLRPERDNGLPKPKTNERETTSTSRPNLLEKYLADSIAFERSKPQFKFLNKKRDFISFSFADHETRIPGFDPEVMVISTNDYIIISWRGTDNIYAEDIFEWIASDFYFIPVSGDGPLTGAKLHAGMWTSFKLIRAELMKTLNSFEAKSKNKKVFITGHSLGGGMALLSAPYLAGSGYNIGGVYTFGAPRTIGDQNYLNRCNSLVGRQKIQRFENGVDPITKMWSPLLDFSQFKIPGVRNWYSTTAGSKNDEFYDCDERRYPMTANPVAYLAYSRESIDRENGDFGLGLGLPGDLLRLKEYILNAVEGNKERPKDARGFALIDFAHHNPTFYTLKAYDVLPNTDKAKLPAPEDTFPYVLPAVTGNK